MTALDPDRLQARRRGPPSKDGRQEKTSMRADDNWRSTTQVTSFTATTTAMTEANAPSIPALPITAAATNKHSGATDGGAREAAPKMQKRTRIKLWLRRIVPSPAVLSPERVSTRRRMSTPVEMEDSRRRSFFTAFRRSESDMEEAHEVVREYVVPPVVIPREYRQQERTGVRVGGSRVRFTRDAHMHHRKAIRLMHTVEEDSEYIDTVVPTIQNAWMCTRKPAKSRRCKSARLD